MTNPPMKELKDKDGSSEEDLESIPDLQYMEEESSDLDDDIFQGAFAIKDVADNTAPDPKDRFSFLPSKVAKYVERFDGDVLDSIPADLSESGTQTCRIMSPPNMDSCLSTVWSLLSSIRGWTSAAS